MSKKHSRVLLGSSALISLTLVGWLAAPPALGDTYQRCAESNHDSSQVTASAILQHNPDPYYYASTETSPDYAACPNNLVATNVVDVYVARYADRLKDGSWSNCHKYVKGWRGANVGYGELWSTWSSTTGWAIGDGSCQWRTYKVRIRGLGKAQFKDGHVVSAWAYTPGHPHI